MIKVKCERCNEPCENPYEYTLVVKQARFIQEVKLGESLKRLVLGCRIDQAVWKECVKIVIGVNDGNRR